MERLVKASLQALFEAIAQAQSESDLSKAAIAKVGDYFSARRQNLWLVSQMPAIDDETPALMRRALSLEENPVLRYLVQRHSAVHDEVVLPPGVWKTICPRADHGHVMVGPVVHQGKLIGGIGVTRHRDDPAFTAENLADLSALSLHFSTRLTLLRSQSSIADLEPADSRLTPRERQIAELVAQGLTNKKVGAALWITENSVKQALKRMFRKLEVSSRAEMVAQLSIGRAIASPQTTL